MPLSAEELVNALHEAASAKNVDNFVGLPPLHHHRIDVHASPGVGFHDRPLNFHPREADEPGFEPGRCVSVTKYKTQRQKSPPPIPAPSAPGFNAWRTEAWQLTGAHKKKGYEGVATRPSYKESN